MKEKISGEINSGINKGREYADKAVKSTFSVAVSIGKACVGEKRLELHRGEWERHPVRPGITEMLRMIRK
ncbi:hypothetical protein HYS95_03200 [Candidatus Daviesbacteria bacterium]|nr:hypothetical protein [Candidatus Daviesbacteria bacterium]